jgi:aspartate/methionine/tyrosine aminotransferase
MNPPLPPLSIPLLGGGVRDAIIKGRQASTVEKRHLVLKRWFTEQAAARGEALIDVGTDYTYPYFEDYGPTRGAITAIGTASHTARHYPSSYGTEELRSGVVKFFHRLFNVELDAACEVMVSTGASQVFDALSRTFAGPVVLIPELALSTVSSIAVGNGAEVVRINLDERYRPCLRHLVRTIKAIGAENIRFLYLNSPMNPTGIVLDWAYLERLTDIAHRHQVLLVHDHDSWFTVHRGARSVNVLQIPGAADVAVTILSVSKELGLPGIRVGVAAGNRTVINALRMHNSEFCVMVPEFCQAAAAAALRKFVDPHERHHVQQEIVDAREAALLGWRELGWPPDALMPPDAGFKFLLRPPPAFGDVSDDRVSGVELFDFLVARDAHVKLSTVRSFNPNRVDWMRMIIMQRPEVMQQMFRALTACGVCYTMRVPLGLAEDYCQVTAHLDLWNL